MGKVVYIVKDWHITVEVPEEKKVKSFDPRTWSKTALRNFRQYFRRVA